MRSLIVATTSGMFADCLAAGVGSADRLAGCGSCGDVGFRGKERGRRPQQDANSKGNPNALHVLISSAPDTCNTYLTPILTNRIRRVLRDPYMDYFSVSGCIRLASHGNGERRRECCSIDGLRNARFRLGNFGKICGGDYPAHRACSIFTENSLRIGKKRII